MIQGAERGLEALYEINVLDWRLIHIRISLKQKEHIRTKVSVRRSAIES